jgi:hypothetical protein
MGTKPQTATITIEKTDIDVAYYLTEYDPGDRETPPCKGEMEITDIFYKKSSIIDVIFELGGVPAMQKLEGMILKQMESKSFRQPEYEMEEADVL